MLNIDQDLFNENLLLTQAYCELQLKNAGKHIAEILRSFNPVYNGKNLFSFKMGFYFYNQWQIDPLTANNEYLYYELFETQLQNKQNTVGQINPLIKFEGKILIADIDQVIRDGASQEASDGFIDDNDCPPIDTWFYIVKTPNTRVLFAWIPQRFVHYVQEGIDTNMLNTFNWYDDYEESRYSKQLNTEWLIKSEQIESNGAKSLWAWIKKAFSPGH